MELLEAHEGDERSADSVLEALAMLTAVGKVLYPGEDDFQCLWHAADYLLIQDEPPSSWNAAWSDILASVNQEMRKVNLSKSEQIKVVKAVTSVFRRLQASPDEQRMFLSVLHAFRQVTRLLDSEDWKSTYGG